MEVTLDDFQRDSWKSSPRANIDHNTLRGKFECAQCRQRIHEMLADNFEWVRDTCEIDGLVPRKQLRLISQKLIGLLFGETDTEPVGGRDKELAQGMLVFHVEQLRQIRKEVKSL